MSGQVSRRAKCAARGDALWLDDFISGLMHDDVHGSLAGSRHRKGAAKSEAVGMSSSPKVPEVPQSWQAPCPAGQPQVPTKRRPVSAPQVVNSARERRSPQLSARRPASAPQPRPGAAAAVAAVRQRRKHDWQCHTWDANPLLARAPDVHGAGFYALRDSRLAAALSAHAEEARAMAAHRRAVSTAAREQGRACAARRRREAVAAGRCAAGHPEQPSSTPEFVPRPPSSPPPPQFDCLHEAFRQKVFERMVECRRSEGGSTLMHVEHSKPITSLVASPPDGVPLASAANGGGVAMGFTDPSGSFSRDECVPARDHDCAAEESNTYSNEYEDDFNELSGTTESC